MSILLYGYTTWMLTKRIEKKLDGNCTRMLRSTFNTSWRQHLAKQQLYGHLPPISKTIQRRRIRHAKDCWRDKDDLRGVVLLSHGCVSVGRPIRNYLQRLCVDTGCSLDLSVAMNDRDEWRERCSEIRASIVTWWWWWWWWYWQILK